MAIWIAYKFVNLPIKGQKLPLYFLSEIPHGVYICCVVSSDEMGMGKTISLLALIVSNPMPGPSIPEGI